MLKAADELRHEMNDDPHFRESLYFNFADAENNLGGWIYLWVVPNQELKSGMLCSFYRGLHPEPSTSARAQQEPGHALRGANGHWMYFFAKNVPELLTTDFDDVELCGLHLRRTQPLGEYRLTYGDDSGNGFDLTGNFLTLPYDYADHPNPTPSWMAANRYHRAWKVNGTLRVGGEDLRIDTTGDSDHSWGRRHNEQFTQFLFKMWSAQAGPDLAFSVVTMGDQGAEIPYGFLSLDGTMAPVVKVSESATYGPGGLQDTGRLNITDDRGRSIEATSKMFASIAAGTPPGYWGHEGAARYTINGVRDATGIVSLFWPGSISPAELMG